MARHGTAPYIFDYGAEMATVQQVDVSQVSEADVAALAAVLMKIDDYVKVSAGS